MWIRELKILKQTDKGNGIFVTLFELILWNKRTRYHATVHTNQITKKDFENRYTAKDYNYFPKAKAEMLYELMIKSEVEIKPVIQKEDAKNSTSGILQGQTA